MILLPSFNNYQHTVSPVSFVTLSLSPSLRYLQDTPDISSAFISSANIPLIISKDKEVVF